MVGGDDGAVYPRAGVGVECGEAPASGGEDVAEVLVAGEEAGGGGEVHGGDRQGRDGRADVADDGAGVEVGANVHGEAAAQVIRSAEAPRARVEPRALQGKEDAV